MTTPIRVLRGECYCRTVSFEVRDAFEYALYCHCSDCRRRTGAGSKPFAGAKADALWITTGAEAVQHLGGDMEHHASCSRCGSLLYSRVRGGAYVHVSLGALVDPPTIRPSAHIFVGSKAPWDLICDELPQFEALPPD
jgi:hypothetical protein